MNKEYAKFISAAIKVYYRNSFCKMYVADCHAAMDFWQDERKFGRPDTIQFGFLDREGAFTLRAHSWKQGMRNITWQGNIPRRDLDIAAAQGFADEFNAKSTEPAIAPQEPKLSAFGEIRNFVLGARVKGDE